MFDERATLAKALRVGGGGGFTVHGSLSFRDWAAEMGYADAWAEARSPHESKSTESAYKRTRFRATTDSLMPAWASFV